MLTVESVVRGYHVYKDDWSPSVGDEFELEIEELNRQDRYAVAIKVSGDIVGHVPREFSKIVYYFIKNGGRVTGEVRAKRQRSAVHMKGRRSHVYTSFTHQVLLKLKSWLLY